MSDVWRGKIYIATDHAGFELKNRLVSFLRNELGYEVEDMGAYEYDANDDFTDFIPLAARAVANNPKGSRAIVLGGSGQGEAMASNRFKGVRATVYYGCVPEMVNLSRSHNDANVLSLGARFIDTEEAKKVVSDWLLALSSDEDKYKRRNKALDTLSEDAVVFVKSEEPIIIPAIIPTSLFDLREKLEQVSFADWVQIDVVDGDFVSYSSWPYGPKGEVSDASDLLRSRSVEVDLMVRDQATAVKEWCSAGVSRIIAHLEGWSDLTPLWHLREEYGCEIVLAIVNDTPLEYLLPYIKMSDGVQLMGIANIGVQGQEFDKRVIRRVSALREAFPDLVISIDGSVNKATVKDLVLAGANRLVSGSAIFNAEDVSEAYAQLLALTKL